MKKIIVLAFALALGCGAGADAQTVHRATYITGFVGPVYFSNRTTSPVWVTFYTSNSQTGTSPHSIQGTRCVRPRHIYTYKVKAREVKVLAEAQKGHGDLCNTGTYWKDSVVMMGETTRDDKGAVAALAGVNGETQPVTARITSQASGATTLDFDLGYRP